MVTIVVMVTGWQVAFVVFQEERYKDIWNNPVKKYCGFPEDEKQSLLLHAECEP